MPRLCWLALLQGCCYRSKGKRKIRIGNHCQCQELRRRQQDQIADRAPGSTATLMIERDGATATTPRVVAACFSPPCFCHLRFICAILLHFIFAFVAVKENKMMKELSHHSAAVITFKA
jgi:hypothetical protein